MDFSAFTRPVGRYWQRLLSFPNSGSVSDQDQLARDSDLDDQHSTNPSSRTHSVTYEDVRDTRTILRSLELPTELVLEILDRARYWPCQRFVMRRRTCAHAMPSNEAANLCLDAGVLTPAFLETFGEEKPKIKEIVWDIRSKDQGWTSEGTEGTFQTSSWLDVSILRSGPEGVPDTPITDKDLGVNSGSPRRFGDALHSRGWTLVTCPAAVDNGNDELECCWHLQSNRVASPQIEQYRVLWRADKEEFEGNEGAGNGHGFFQSIQPRDRILVWARARYAGWQCCVESLSMTIYYGF